MPRAEPDPLGRNTAFRRLWLARAASEIGDGAALIALLLLVKSRYDSGPTVGLVLLAFVLPALLGPVAGAVADRFEPKRLMVGCDLGRAIVFAVIAWSEPPLPVLLVLLLAAASLDRLFAPASASAAPLLVRKEDLLRANAWLGTATNLQVTLGPLLGAGFAAALGPRLGIGVNAASFLVSAALLAGLPTLRSAGLERLSLPAVREGIRYVRFHPVAGLLAFSLLVGVAFASLDNVSLVFLSRNVFHASALGFGLATSAYGVGMLTGSLGVSAVSARIAPARLYLAGWILFGAGAIATGLSPALGVAALMLGISGLGNALGNIAFPTLLQQTVAPGMLGRVFGVVGSAPFVGSALAYAAGGFLLDATSPRTTFVLAGVGSLAMLAVLWQLPRRAALAGAVSGHADDGSGQVAVDVRTSGTAARSQGETLA